MITIENIQRILRERGFSVAQATSSSSAIAAVSDFITSEVPPLLHQAGIGLGQLASNPAMLEKAADVVHKRIPLPWRWVIGKNGTVAIVKAAAARGATTAASLAARTAGDDGRQACVGCGSTIEAGSRYCRECGRLVSETERPDGLSDGKAI